MYFILNKCGKIDFLLHGKNKFIRFFSNMKGEVLERALPVPERRKIH